MTRTFIFDYLRDLISRLYKYDIWYKNYFWSYWLSYNFPFAWVSDLSTLKSQVVHWLSGDPLSISDKESL